MSATGRAVIAEALDAERVREAHLSWKAEAHRLAAERDRLAGEAERLQVQLAGCLTAADGWAGELAEDAYGWSVAFARVREVRTERDRLAATVQDLQQECIKWHEIGVGLDRQIAALTAERDRLAAALRIAKHAMKEAHDLGLHEWEGVDGDGGDGQALAALGPLLRGAIMKIDAALQGTP